MFAASPPPEAKIMLLSLAVTAGVGCKHGLRQKGKNIYSIGVRRAYFHAKARRMVFLRLPPEDNEEGECGLLEKAMYGTRDAAQNWAHEYIEFTDNDGFHKSRASPCMFYHKGRISG